MTKIAGFTFPDEKPRPLKLSTIDAKAALLLATFMKMRHEIWVKRSKGLPPPWTDDPVLSEYRFCNVYRELDTVTIWIRENIREPFADHKMLWFMLCIARRINLPATLEELMADKKGAWPTSRNKWSPERMVEILDARTARGDPVYTGAYMITAETGPEHIGKTKSRTTAFSNLMPLVAKANEIEPQLHDSLLKAFHALLGQGFAWGPFMCYEVVSDLRWTRYLDTAPDIMTWANAGPGAFRGLNRLAGRPVKEARRPEEALTEMRDLLPAVQRNWPKAWPKLEMREIEHSLCEYDKYMRVVNGEGAPRSKYRPAATTK